MYHASGGHWYNPPSESRIYINVLYDTFQKYIFNIYTHSPSKILELEKNNLRYSVTINETFVY